MTFRQAYKVSSLPPLINNLCVLYRQLEENINKWSLELEDMEKVFLNQATMVNAWDQMLIKNGAKIVSLNESVAAVRADQQRLEHELDFVASQVCKSFTRSFLVFVSGGVGMKYYVAKTDGNIFLSAQQAELEEALQPLEASLAASGQTVDSERERTYALAESLDGQLARMCGDLKEVGCPSFL